MRREALVEILINEKKKRKKKSVCGGGQKRQTDQFGISCVYWSVVKLELPEFSVELSVYCSAYVTPILTSGLWAVGCGL